MKNYPIPSLLLSFGFFLLSVGNIQAQAVAVNPPGKGDTKDANGNCTGRSVCSESIQVLSGNRSMDNGATFSLFKNAKGKVVFKLPKSALEAAQIEEMKTTDAYYLPQDTPLEQAIQEAFEAEKVVVLARGWHPLIELEDCFIIYYTLK
jgi:hypothetical protein